MGKFVHLHLHSEYSLLDGAVRLTQQVMKKNDEGKWKAETAYPLAEALKARGMDAVAITDHGNMYGVHVFVEAMRKNGIKPIVGSEFYVAEDMYVKNSDVLYKNYHLVLLAKNMTGYKNLMKLSSASFVDGFYGKPRIDLDDGVEMVMPGDNITMEIELINPIAIEKGMRFAIREGGRTVGSGVVAEIIK